MKDYTKYDFAAIKGAYVEMEIAPAENPAIHATINGLVVYQDPTSILVLRNSGTVTCFLRSEIVPGSLSAKTKVEDTSLKQLKRFAKTQVEPSGILDVVIRFKEKRIEIFAGWDKKRCVHLFSEQHGLDDYIDCTDWGWKHE